MLCYECFLECLFCVMFRFRHYCSEFLFFFSLQNKYDEAFQLYGRALEIYINQVGLQDERVSEVLTNLSKLFIEQVIIFYCKTVDSR